MNEENNVVKANDGFLDIVVTNINSTSNEEYVVKSQKFKYDDGSTRTKK